MDITKGMTVKEFLEKLAEAKTTDETDEKLLQAVLQKKAFPSAIVTCGVVYLEGHGTIDAPPLPLQTVAKMILNVAKNPSIPTPAAIIVT